MKALVVYDSVFGNTEKVAQAIGPTDVQTLNHHGYRNTHTEFWVRTTQPRVLVHQNWSSDQPGMGVLKRLTSRYLYPGPRDLFGLDILPANIDYIGEAVGLFAPAAAGGGKGTGGRSNALIEGQEPCRLPLERRSRP